MKALNITVALLAALVLGMTFAPSQHSWDLLDGTSRSVVAR